MLEIVQYPNKILRKRSGRVRNIKSPEIQELIEQMGKTMLKADGIGLAANQVNQDLQLLVINFKGEPTVFINPLIYYKSFTKEAGEEGCLSFPGVFGQIKRSQNIRIIYQDKFGKWRHLKAKGLLARVLQHEVDHIRGVLFIDKMKKYSQGEEKVRQWQKEAAMDEI